MTVKKWNVKSTLFLVCIVTIQTICVFPLRRSYGETLFFEDVLQQSILKSYNIELAKIDREIGKHKRAEARAQYFPTLNVRLTDEYFEDLTDPDTVIIRTDITGYRHSLTFYADYNLFDFGARETRYINASREVKIADHGLKKEMMDTKINTLFVYKDGLSLSKKIKAQTTIFKYKTKMYELSKRLHKAGKIGKIDLTESAIMVAEAAQELDALQLEWEKTLQQLSFYTGQAYESDTTDFFDFSEPAPNTYPVTVNDLPEVKIYDIEIKKKEAEFYMMSAEWLPKFSLFSSYQYYGYDPSSFSDAFYNMDDENYRIGLKVEMNLFNGFGDFARAQRLRAELRRLKMERKKTISEQTQLLNTLKVNTRLYKEQTKKWRAYEADISDKSSMDERLAKQRIKDQLTYLQEQIEEVEKRLNIEIKEIDRVANVYHLKFLSEGGSHPGTKPPKTQPLVDQFIADKKKALKKPKHNVKQKTNNTQYYYLNPSVGTRDLGY